jgi:hypothetical protein
LTVTLAELEERSNKALSASKAPPSLQDLESRSLQDSSLPNTRVTPSLQELNQRSDAILQPRQANPAQKSGLTVEDVKSDPERLSRIRTMMAKTKDLAYEQADPDTLMKDFMAHMRFLNTNELSVGKEALDVTSADEELRAIYGDAYKVYEDMGSIFSNGDAWNGSIDYVQSFLTAPSTYLGFGLGRILGQTGTKAASKAVLTQAISATAKQAAKKSGGKISEQVIKNQLKTEAAKVTAKNAVIGTVAVEGGFGAIADYSLQDTMMKTGVQEEYSVLQGALTTVGSSLGAIGPAYMLIKNRNSTLGNVGEILDKSFQVRAKKAAKEALPELKASFEKANANWLELAKKGMEFKDNYHLQKEVANWFFDPKKEDSFVRILQRAGVQLNLEDGEGFTRSIADYAAGLTDDVLEEYNQIFEPMGVKFGEALSIMAAYAREAGQDFNLMSQASKFMSKYQNISVGRKASEKAILEGLTDAGEEAAEVTEKQILNYAQSTWKKTLVSTFGTTAVNVKGWGIARLANAASDMFAAGGLLGRAGIRAVVDPAGAIKDYSKFKHLLQNQVFMFNTLLDPFTTAEGFMKILAKAPKKVQKNITSQVFGGVDDFSAAAFGLNPENKLVKGVEKTTDFFQTLSFVRLQDTITKGITGLTTLDKESRLLFGKGITQLIEDGEAYKITEDMWTNVTKQVLQETFSEDLTRGGAPVISQLAGLIEKVSNTPGLGFVVPFGRFMNNTMAFMYRFGPWGLITPAVKVWKGNFDNLGDSVAKAATGTAALYYMAQNEADKQAQGLQWFERKTQDGSVENISTLFPYSVYALLGRIAHGVNQGEGVNLQLLDELRKNIGPLDALSGLTDPQAITDMLRWLSDPATTAEDTEEFFSLPRVFAQTAGDILAGYTRPIEVYSRAFSYATPEAGGGLAIDRKQVDDNTDTFILGLTRNVSGFFNYFFGEENEYGVRMYGKPKESGSVEGPVKMPNPVGVVGGTTYNPPSKNINKLLALVDKPPFRADSFTSGVPEYDAYINKEVTPFLEREATRLLNLDRFTRLPKSRQIEEVDKMLKQAENELVAKVEGGYLGNENDRLINERRKLLTRDKQARIRAKNALNISTDDHRLTMYQIEAIRRYIDLEREESKMIQK